MRGKKENVFGIYGEKRAPSGFVGMRGKKQGEEFDMKRSPNSGFFGMRGKKEPAKSGFFGMRGKKYPYEFRGKFVGVRGKKMGNEIGGDTTTITSDELARLGQSLDLNQLMLLLTEYESADGELGPE